MTFTPAMLEAREHSADNYVALVEDLRNKMRELDAAIDRMRVAEVEVWRLQREFDDLAARL